MFEREAETTGQALKVLKSRLEALEGGDWVGEAARSFYTEMNGTVLPALTRLTSALREAANTTRKIDQLMRQTDETAAALFKYQAEGGASVAGAGVAGAGAMGSAQFLSSPPAGELDPSTLPQPVQYDKAPGRVVRIEHKRPEDPKKWVPPGPGAFNERQFEEWKDNHPFAGTTTTFLNVINDPEEDKKYVPEKMWQRGYYYARSEEDTATRTRKEIWVNDDEDKKGAVRVLVRAMR